MQVGWAHLGCLGHKLQKCTGGSVTYPALPGQAAALWLVGAMQVLARQHVVVQKEIQAPDRALHQYLTKPRLKFACARVWRTVTIASPDEMGRVAQLCQSLDADQLAGA